MSKWKLPSKIQTLIFNKSHFDLKKARNWAKTHGFKYSKIDEKENTYRIRQLDPTLFGDFRTITITNGIKAVVGPLINPMDWQKVGFYDAKAGVPLDIGLETVPDNFNKKYEQGWKEGNKMRRKNAGYTYCPCCGIDSMNDELCAYCEEAECEEDGSEPRCDDECDLEENPHIDLEPNLWLDEEYEDSDSVSFSHVDQKSLYNKIPLFSVEEAQGSDYSGNTYSKSNYQVFMEMKNDNELDPFIMEIHGGHGSYGIAIRLDKGEVPEEILNAISSLADYPILDESKLSELEMEAEIEAWESWGRNDWRKELVKAFPGFEENIYDATNDEIFELWHRASEQLGWTVEFETGGNARFNFEEAIKKLNIDDMLEILGEPLNDVGYDEGDLEKNPSTYAEARANLINYLQNKEWTISKPLKIPYATSPNGRIRLWFKPQAIWYTLGKYHEFSSARSLHGPDIRSMSPAEYYDWISTSLQ